MANSTPGSRITRQVPLDLCSIFLKYCIGTLAGFWNTFMSRGLLLFESVFNEDFAALFGT